VRRANKPNDQTINALGSYPAHSRSSEIARGAARDRSAAAINAIFFIAPPKRQEHYLWIISSVGGHKTTFHNLSYSDDNYTIMK
jgi:hypothetical protein